MIRTAVTTRVDTHTYLRSVIDGSRRDYGSSALRPALSACAYLYTAGLKLYLLPYRIGIRKQARLACPVISIGNLTVGGTGKTPMTRRVCSALADSGLNPCILSRGYRGASEHSAAVVSDPEGILLDARQAGDEAYLLARMLPGTPVIAGKDRRETGRIACERFHPDVVVLDDGMQFYQLHRDLDIVLVDAVRPFDNGWTFPRGLLREPPSHLRRAGCIVITNADRSSEPDLQALRDRLVRLSPRASIYTARYRSEMLKALDRSSERPLSWLNGLRITSLCGLANPEGFERQLTGAGAVIADTARFPDHHEPTIGELNQVIDRAKAHGSEAIIVSEKDAVKLPPLGRPVPFYAFSVDMRVDEQESFLRDILKALGR